MSETQKPAPEQIENEQHMDSVWFDEFVDIETNQVFEYFAGNSAERNQQRKLFESGEIRNPTLDYPKLDLAELQEKEARFMSLKENVLGDESQPEALKQIYRWSINERLAENRMVQEAAKARDAETDEDRERHMKRFERYSEFLYGPQNEDVFSYYANHLRTEAISLKETGNEHAREVAQKVLDLFPDEKPVNFELPAITDEETRATYREIVLNEYGLSPDAVSEFLEVQSDMTPEEFAEFCIDNQVSIPGADKFKTFAEDDRAVMTFNPARQDLRIPTVKSGSSRMFTPEQALKLELHENQGHLGRSARGYNSKLKILGFGLDRNFKPEEGNAMFNESAIDQEGDPMTGFAGVMAIGLARGLDKPSGEERKAAKRDFAGTNEAMKSIYEMRALLEGKSPEEAEKFAKNTAWGRTVRTFRGTTADTPGVVYQKDIGYGEGFLETHAFFDGNTGRIALLKFGRFDASKERHIKVLLELGILDEELAALAA